MATAAFAFPMLSRDTFMAESYSLNVPAIRRGRSLLDDINSYSMSPATQYLVPTIQPQLCSAAGACCQQDDYASAFRIRMLNSSKAVVAGRSYTTYFMSLAQNSFCDSTVDAAGCCSGSVTTAWIDVDPSLLVRYVTFDGRSSGIVAEQSASGLSITGFNIDASSAPVSGYLMSVTVEGDVKNLCPMPDIAPATGYCSTILTGASGSGAAGVCCPHGLSQLPPKGEVFLPPVDGGFICNSDITQSGYLVSLTDIGLPFYQDGSAFVHYQFSLEVAPGCNADSVASCCSMTLDGLEIKVAAGIAIDKVTIGTEAFDFFTAPWSGAGTAANSYQLLIVSSLGLSSDDVPYSGLDVTITVALASSYVPDLCTATSTSSSGGTIGQCEYFLTSNTEGMCCPAGVTEPVSSPPPICNPSELVPLSDTSISMQYYEHTYATDSSSTSFTFLITDHNGPSQPCGKPFCGNVCGWSLFIADPSQSGVSIDASENSGGGPYMLTPAPNATVAFNYGPSGESTVTYTVTLPGYRSLSDLCQSAALPGQAAKTCSAVLMTPDFYSVFYFSESDLALTSFPPPPLPKDLCAGTPLPLSTACTRVVGAGFNSPADGKSTVFDFKVANHEDEAAPCLADSASPSPTFTVMLQPSVAATLAAHQSQMLQPATATIDATSGSMQWSWTPTAQEGSNVMHYSFNLPTGGLAMAAVCAQGLFHDQPAGSCVVQISGSQYCFRGYITPLLSSGLVWVTEAAPASSTSSSGAIIGGVIGGFFGLLLIVAIAAFGFFAVRRRRNARNAAFNDLGALPGSSDPSASLQRRLASGSSSEGGAAHSTGGLLRATRTLSAPGGPPLSCAMDSVSNRGGGGGLAVVRRTGSDSGGSSILSTLSASPSDIAIQVRRGTISDAGAPLEPMSPEDVLLSCSTGQLMSDADLSEGGAQQQHRAAHYSLPPPEHSLL